MRALLIIVLAICASKASKEATIRCSDKLQDGLTFEPSEDKIDGRYKVEWCTQPEKSDIRWDLVLNYCNNEIQSSCQQSKCRESSHSKFELPVTINLNCTRVLVTRSVFLWVGARGSEFDWRYVRACAEANVALLQTAGAATLVWLRARSDLPQRHAPLVLALLLLAPYRALLENALGGALALGPWALLSLRAVHASVVALAALAVYAVLAKQIGV